MTYHDNTQLPSALQKLPSAAQNMFRKIANQQMKKGDSQDKATKVAWTIVKGKFRKQANGTWVARTDAFKQTEYFVFDAKPAEQFIERTENGHIIHNYILTDLFPDSLGTAPTEGMLNEWAAWLNEHKPEVDTDHSMFQKMKEQYGGNVSMVERAMKFKKGIAKTVKAFVDKGKLIVSLMFDKRYERHVEKVKGLSVEAAVTVDDDTGKWSDGKIFGYTLALDKNPVNPRSTKI